MQIGQSAMSGRGWPLLLDELSLVKGVNLSKADTKSRASESVYYLGGPDDLSLSDLDGDVWLSLMMRRRSSLKVQ